MYSTAVQFFGADKVKMLVVEKCAALVANLALDDMDCADDAELTASIADAMIALKELAFLTGERKVYEACQKSLGALKREIGIKE